MSKNNIAEAMCDKVYQNLAAG